MKRAGRLKKIGRVVGASCFAASALAAATLLQGILSDPAFAQTPNVEELSLTEAMVSLDPKFAKAEMRGSEEVALMEAYRTSANALVATRMALDETYLELQAYGYRASDLDNLKGLISTLEQEALRMDAAIAEQGRVVDAMRAGGDADPISPTQAYLYENARLEEQVAARDWLSIELILLSSAELLRRDIGMLESRAKGNLQELAGKAVDPAELRALNELLNIPNATR